MTLKPAPFMKKLIPSSITGKCMEIKRLAMNASHSSLLALLRITKEIINTMETRLAPIMLLKLPIMLWSNAPMFFLLCSNYAL